MTTQGDKATATIIDAKLVDSGLSASAVQAEYVGRKVLGKMLGVSPSTVTKRINEWRAAGKDIPELHRKFHLESVRRAALEAARESY